MQVVSNMDINIAMLEQVMAFIKVIFLYVANQIEMFVRGYV